MSVLSRRVARQPEHATTHAMGNYHPVAPHEMTMPVALVRVTADAVEMEEAVPLYAARGGAPIPATGPGHWDQLYAAGKP